MQFQSTPTITGRRIIDPLAYYILAKACFNPRPPLLVGESGLANMPSQLSTLFQSTPTITGRRILVVLACAAMAPWFQSTPTITGRRIACKGVDGAHGVDVSIHAHHYW